MFRYKGDLILKSIVAGEHGLGSSNEILKAKNTFVFAGDVAATELKFPAMAQSARDHAGAFLAYLAAAIVSQKAQTAYKPSNPLGHITCNICLAN